MNAAKTLVCAIVLFHLMLQLCLSDQQLKVGFYFQTCPNAESIVTSVLKEEARTNPILPPLLLRLHFHDCFVEGCDGSILIDNPSERNHVDANRGLGGFDQIKKAKQELEAQCPGTVSCADIVALAARDAVHLAGGPFYEVETGRRDGRVSNASLAEDQLPDVNDSIDTLKSKFRNKGLSEKELVLLSGGAHTIGRTACFFMQKRLYNFTGRNDSDPEINPKLLTSLKSQCPKGLNLGTKIPLDVMTSEKFDDQILHNIKDGFAVLSSDARLYDDNITKKVVDFYVGGSLNSSFGQDFAMAMVKMGRIDVKIGTDGEIRKVCNSIN